MAPFAPYLVAMVVLVAFSAFFSCSEAALFSLRWQDRIRLRDGSPLARLADHLLTDPERLLSAILFWNLVVNMAYFALASIVSLQLERSENGSDSAAAAFAVGSLMLIIFFSEMIPKTLGVIRARPLAVAFSFPLSIAVRVTDPLLPGLRMINLLSRRLIWPGFQSEPYLEIADLERAIELSSPGLRESAGANPSPPAGSSGDSGEIAHQEKAMLRHLVDLSGIRADEWMRPRAQFLTFRPPVSLADLEGRLTPSGYLLITEPDGDEVTSAVDLLSVGALREQHLEREALPVVYVPWCAPVADVAEMLLTQDRQVAAVVNEFGDTMGVLTVDDILDSIFALQPQRSQRLLNRQPIESLADGVWRVTGATGLRRLARRLGVEPAPGKSMTVAGLLEEKLEHPAERGDVLQWSSLRLEVITAPERGPLLVEVTKDTGRTEEPNE